MPAPRGHERHAVLIAELDDGSDFGGRLRKHGDARAVLFDDERVALVDGQVGMGVEHAVWAEQSAEWFGQIGGDGSCAATCPFGSQYRARRAVRQ